MPHRGAGVDPRRCVRALDRAFLRGACVLFWEREVFLVKIMTWICFRFGNGFLNKVQAFPGGNQLSQRVFESHLFLSPPHLEEFAEIYII